jgi:ubiquinol-cytochrome c reductase cytochrome c1 subunit
MPDPRPQDYVYSLLTGYVDPPPGVTVAEGMNYNPYFPGGGIAMGRVLYDGLVEYEDGTPASTSQMAKDVVSFLSWTAEPELDERKKMGLQVRFSLHWGRRCFSRTRSTDNMVMTTS